MTDTSVALGTNGDASTGRSVASRLSALARGVDRLRTRPKIDMRQGLLFAGAIAMSLGFVAIVLGWYGASHSAYLFQEIPYLISGGLLGVALVAGGGFLFFSAWFVRMLEDNRRFAERVARSLDTIDRAMSVSDGADSTSRPAPWSGAPAGSRSNGA